MLSAQILLADGASVSFGTELKTAIAAFIVGTVVGMTGMGGGALMTPALIFLGVGDASTLVTADLTAAEEALKAEVLALLGSKSGATLGTDVGAIAGRLRAAKPASASADELFASLPRMTPQGLVSTPLGPWSKQPLGGSAT